MYDSRQPHREWVDDIVDWCRATLQKLGYILHQNRTKLVVSGNKTKIGTATQQPAWVWGLG